MSDTPSTWSTHLVEEAQRLWSVDLTQPQFAPLVEPTADSKFGDFMTGIPFRLARALRKPARVIAEELAGALSRRLPPMILSVQVAGGGYVNFFTHPRFWVEALQEVLAVGDEFGRSMWGKGRRVSLEHCSANPTGPLHVAHGRQAAVGDTLANILAFAGCSVTREFYINDTGGQIENLGRSLHTRYAELFGKQVPFPEGGYHGEYIRHLAKELAERWGDQLIALPESEAVTQCKAFGVGKLLREIRETLDRFGVRYDVFTSQAAIEAGGKVQSVLTALETKGALERREEKTWFKAKDYGDQQDWCLVREDGTYTYHAPDLAYHLDKRARGADLLIDFWGPDHHAHIAMMKAGLRALGEDADKVLTVLTVQQCTLKRGGQEVKMSKRSGEMITLRELMEEVGVDAARFFFVMRKTDSHLDFDIEMAKQQTLDNPVYYVQYAHARICSIFGKGMERGLIDSRDIVESAWRGQADLSLLGKDEIEIVRLTRGFTRAVEDAARNLDTVRITNYLTDLSREFQSYYTRGDRDKALRVLIEDEPLRRMRLAVCAGVQTVLRNGLRLLGVSAPNRMEKIE